MFQGTYNPGQNSWATYMQTGPKTTLTPPVNVGRTNHSARCAVGNNIAKMFLKSHSHTCNIPRNVAHRLKK